MPYLIKEIFYSLQGEGFHAGRPAVFCRFAGCNLWSGREEDRPNAKCRFCDTDFTNVDGSAGGKYDSADDLVEVLKQAWPEQGDHLGKFLVCTGGEPLLQLDVDLIDALHRAGFSIAVETNGTLPAPQGIDWITISPKAGTTLALSGANELKLVYPQDGLDPAQFENFNCDHLYLQPMDGPSREQNTRDSIQYCLDHPRWKLSLQMHKIIGIR